jgi:septal ring factor EnvC (AmiA/AmiB activator)
MARDVSEAVAALEAALSALRDYQVELARKAEWLKQARDAERDRSKLFVKCRMSRALAEQALWKLQADLSDADVLRIQLEAEVERLREALTKAEAEARRPWWRRPRSGG